MIMCMNIIIIIAIIIIIILIIATPTAIRRCEALNLWCLHWVRDASESIMRLSHVSHHCLSIMVLAGWRRILQNYNICGNDCWKL